MRRLVRLLLTLAAFAAAPAHAQDQAERIRQFTSDVHVQRNGGLDVTETIRLVSAGEQIKHGIQRDFPTRYTNGLGQKTSTTFDVVSVARDGSPEHYELMSLTNGVRVRIGAAETELSPGEHTFVIHYRTTRQISYGAKTDELYWNATGTGWTFPIDMAEARITLPAPAQFGDRATYTGPDGSTAHDAAVVGETPGQILFRTTRPLPAYAGLTVAAAFPKGVLDVPSAGQKLRWWLNDWGPLVGGVAALIALLGYYFRAWLLVGRGPRAGTVVPLFVPPEGISAAAARYISRMKADNRGFTAAIVDLAVAGHVRITKGEDGWLTRGTTKLDRIEGGKPVRTAETAMVAALFGSGDQLVLKQENHSRLQGAAAMLNNNLEAEYQGTMFDKHRDWATFGLLAIVGSVALLTLFAALVRVPPASSIEIKTLLVVLALLTFAWWLSKREGTLASVAFFPVMLIGGFIGIGTVFSALASGAWPVLLPLLALPFGLSAFAWLYAPTKEGRVVMDQIAGFKHYLGITEEERLDRLNPPEKTPELFERYLPYAIALDVENRWAERFAGVLATAAAAGAATQTMGWYSGSNDFWSDPGGFANSVGSSLANTVSSASTSPSSSGSSGSSGGGSSGGGGGGGGGSGW